MFYDNNKQSLFNFETHMLSNSDDIHSSIVDIHRISKQNKTFDLAHYDYILQVLLGKDNPFLCRNELFVLFIARYIML